MTANPCAAGPKQGVQSRHTASGDRKHRASGTSASGAKATSVAAFKAIARPVPGCFHCEESSRTIKYRCLRCARRHAPLLMRHQRDESGRVPLNQNNHILLITRLSSVTSSIGPSRRLRSD
jgi:hypothetical protein